MWLVRDIVGFKTLLRFLKCLMLQLHPRGLEGEKEGENPPSSASVSQGWSTIPAWGLGCHGPRGFSAGGDRGQHQRGVSVPSPAPAHCLLSLS